MGGILGALEAAGTAVADAASYATGALSNAGRGALSNAANGGSFFVGAANGLINGFPQTGTTSNASNSFNLDAGDSSSFADRAGRTVLGFGNDAASGFSNGFMGQKNYFLNPDGSMNWTKALMGAAGAYAQKAAAGAALGKMKGGSEKESLSSLSAIDAANTSNALSADSNMRSNSVQIASNKDSSSKQAGTFKKQESQENISPSAQPAKGNERAKLLIQGRL